MSFSFWFHDGLCALAVLGFALALYEGASSATERHRHPVQQCSGRTCLTLEPAGFGTYRDRGTGCESCPSEGACLIGEPSHEQAEQADLSPRGAF
ncbi:MAG: hypothetical protein AAGD10_09985 [Myxococcota bacterium]